MPNAHFLSMAWRPRSGLRTALFTGLAAAAVVTVARAEDLPPDGGAIYMRQGCFTCHGEFGEGGVGPRLAGDPMLAIDGYPVAQILIGRGVMPSFAGRLTDEQIAAVANYIRNSWGNAFGAVSPAVVAHTRELLESLPQAAAKAAR